jgi:hypothetical protein
MKYISEFVRRQKELDAIPREKLLWNSQDGTRYIKRLHGELNEGLNDYGKKIQSEMQLKIKSKKTREERR